MTVIFDCDNYCDYNCRIIPEMQREIETLKYNDTTIYTNETISINNIIIESNNSDNSGEEDIISESTTEDNLMVPTPHIEHNNKTNANNNVIIQETLNDIIDIIDGSVPEDIREKHQEVSNSILLDDAVVKIGNIEMLNELISEPKIISTRKFSDALTTTKITSPVVNNNSPEVVNTTINHNEFVFNKNAPKSTKQKISTGLSRGVKVQHVASKNVSILDITSYLNHYLTNYKFNYKHRNNYIKIDHTKIAKSREAYTFAIIMNTIINNRFTLDTFELEFKDYVNCKFNLIEDSTNPNCTKYYFIYDINACGTNLYNLILNELKPYATLVKSVECVNDKIISYCYFIRDVNIVDYCKTTIYMTATCYNLDYTNENEICQHINKKFNSDEYRYLDNWSYACNKN